VPRPRHSDQLVSPSFLATRKHLEDLIHPPFAEQRDRLPMVRLTQVGKTTVE